MERECILNRRVLFTIKEDNVLEIKSNRYPPSSAKPHAHTHVKFLMERAKCPMVCQCKAQQYFPELEEDVLQCMQTKPICKYKVSFALQSVCN